MAAAYSLNTYIEHLDAVGERLGPDELRALLKAFAALPPYRSAVVAELILDRDFCRRALRPDDLEFVDFAHPIGPETSSSLSAFASNRMLLCANESPTVVLPPDAGGRRWTEFRAFYSDRNRALSGLVRPFLERHALGYLVPPEMPRGAGRRRLRDAIESERGRAQSAATCCEFISRTAASHRDLQRFRVIQFVGLARARFEALERVVDGWLASVDPAARTARALIRPWKAVDLEVAGRLLGVAVDRHACWQFYLPGSLAVANVAHMLAAGVEPFRALGAILAGAAAIERFVHEHAEVAAALGVTVGVDVATAADAMVGAVANQYGESAWDQAALGFVAAARAQEQADRDLSRQLSWLARIDDFRALARTINDKIETERIPVARDSFVEPREMCSTTHVHDDHRLVVVESGEMVFWGMPGMQLVLPPGQMMLVPRHRLHGSSVLTDVCVYHQPIIPEQWIQQYEETAGYALA